MSDTTQPNYRSALQHAAGVVSRLASGAGTPGERVGLRSVVSELQALLDSLNIESLNTTEAASAVALRSKGASSFGDSAPFDAVKGMTYGDGDGVNERALWALRGVSSALADANDFGWRGAVDTLVARLENC